MTVENQTDTERVTCMQNANLIMHANPTPPFKITSDKLSLNNITSDPFDVKTQKLTVLKEFFTSVEKMSSEHNKFLSVISDILTGSTSDSEKVAMMRTFLIKNAEIS